MDKQDLLSKIGYLKSEVYKPALRPYWTAIVDVCDALEALLQEVFKPEMSTKTVHRGADTGMKRRSVDAKTSTSAVVEARRLKAERQARWRAKKERAEDQRRLTSPSTARDEAIALNDQVNACIKRRKKERWPVPPGTSAKP